MAEAVSCPRCAGPVRPPDLAVSTWRCVRCGPIAPLHMPASFGPAVVTAITAEISRGPTRVPVWCPWPLPPGWLVTGVAWAGDDRTGAHATALACSGPAPLQGGPADLLLIAEEPGVGLGNRFAGLPGCDPDVFAEAVAERPPAKVKAAGHDTPMWNVGAGDDRVAYVGEARGLWLYAVAWPADAGYLLAEEITLHDLTDWLPTELVYGAPSPYLHS